MLTKLLFLGLLLPGLAQALPVRSPPPDNCVGNAPCDWDDVLNEPTKDMNHRHVLPKDELPQWEIKSPGNIEMLGTGFTISFDDSDLHFHLFWYGREIAHDEHLYVVKEIALQKSRDLRRTGFKDRDK